MKRGEAFSQRYQIRSACARCHRLKTKCVYEDPHFASCKRCFDLAIECSTHQDPTAKRARRRQQPSRLVKLLGELDKELARMRGGGDGERDQTDKGNEGAERDQTDKGNEGAERDQTDKGNERDRRDTEDGGEVEREEREKVHSGQTTLKHGTPHGLKHGTHGSRDGTHGSKHGTHGSKDDTHGSNDDTHGSKDGTSHGSAIDVLPQRETVCKLFASVLAHGEHLGLSPDLSHVLPGDSRLRYAYFLSHMRPSYPILRIPHRLTDYDLCLKESPELLSACVFATTINNHELVSDIGVNGLSNDLGVNDLSNQLGVNLSNQLGVNDHSNELVQSHVHSSQRFLGAKNCHSAQTKKRKIQPRYESCHGWNYHGLKSYIDKTLAQLVFVKANDFSPNLVTALMVLSLWSLPPGKPGHFKSQMDLLIAYSVSICIDIGPDSDLDTLRSFVSVFCCCGTLSLSLSRFRLASWSKKHSLAVHMLSATSSPDDAFLCAYSRIIVEGLKLMDFLSDVSLSASSLASEKELVEALPTFHEATPLAVPVQRVSEWPSMVRLDHPHYLDKSVRTLPSYAPRLLMLVSYHQVLSSAYEHVLGLCVFHVQMHQLSKTPADHSATMTWLIHRLGDSCSMLLACVFHVSETRCLSYFPTLMYYRALSALMALVRVSILVKSDVVRSHLASVSGVIAFDLSDLYGKVVRVFELYSHTSSSVSTAQSTHASSEPNAIQDRFSVILKRIGAWVEAIENDSVGSGAIKNSLPKGQEVEYLRDPSTKHISENALAKDQTRDQTRDQPKDQTKNSGNDARADGETCESGSPGLTVPTHSDYDVVSDLTIQGIFKELEDDIERFLDPFNDSPFRADELFGFEP